jgi:hypothetical protein
MENKLPLEYGPREAAVLEEMIRKGKAPSKNEAFRRGVLALSYLDKADKSVLLKMLAHYLGETASHVRDSNEFSKLLDSSRTLAYEIVATFAAQKGVQGADAIDIFRSSLDDYFVMIRSGGFKSADKERLANRLYALSEMAIQFSEKEESKEQVEVGRSNQQRRISSLVRKR